MCEIDVSAARRFAEQSNFDGLLAVVEEARDLVIDKGTGNSAHQILLDVSLNHGGVYDDFLAHLTETDPDLRHYLLEYAGIPVCGSP